jgi:hypothetical protein
MRRALLSLILIGCGVPPAPPVDAGQLDLGVADAGVDAGSKAAGCASVFGTGLPTSFGRFDGVVTAVVTPADTQCALPNSDHVVVQVRTDAGIYRMVVNVQSSFGDPDVRLAAISAPLLGGPWSEGWHPGLTLDYPTNLSMHTDAGFTPMPMALLIQRVSDEITVGEKISVFADSSGGTYSDSTHKIHRNGGFKDGALVLNPEAASARWLLFHFANQTF